MGKVVCPNHVQGREGGVAHLLDTVVCLYLPFLVVLYQWSLLVSDVPPCLVHLVLRRHQWHQCHVVYDQAQFLTQGVSLPSHP